MRPSRSRCVPSWCRGASSGGPRWPTTAGRRHAPRPMPPGSGHPSQHEFRSHCRGSAPHLLPDRGVLPTADRRRRAHGVYLSHGLAARGIPTQVITRQTIPPALPEETIGSVRVRRIPPGGLLKGIGWRAVPAVLTYVCRLAFILLSEAARYDVVIISGLKIIPLAAVPVCRLLGKRCIIRIESTFELAEPLSAESRHSMGLMGRLLQGVLRRTQQYVLRRAEPVVAISREVEGKLLDLGVASTRIARIPNGIDLSRFHPVAADEK